MKKIILLGASGSIGIQSINVIRNHSDEFELIGLSVGNNIDILKDILSEFSIKIVCVKNKDDAKLITDLYNDIDVYYGDEGLNRLCEYNDYDLLINALVGSVGLKPTLVAIENKKDIALANKETLVVGGKFVKEAIRKNKVNLYPIDSEHSAIFQCLQGNDKKDIDKIIITASGGSFRNKTRDELKNVTLEDALNHPNWSMGKKITIDSATMMNKGLEVIEAHYLFDIDYDQIDTIIHPESIIHSMVKYNDKSIIAQLGTADMKLPIQYAMSYPRRLKLYESNDLDLAQIATLNFKKLDYNRYPMVKFAYESGRKEGNALAILNAANEEAVNLYLSNEITFLQIEDIVEDAIKTMNFIHEPSLDDIFDTDKETRAYVINKWKGV